MASAKYEYEDDSYEQPVSNKLPRGATSLGKGASSSLLSTAQRLIAKLESGDSSGFGGINAELMGQLANEKSVEGRWWKTRRRGVKAEQRTYYGQMQAYMGISHETAPNGKPYWLNWQLDAPLTRGLFVAVNTDTEQIHAELVEYEPAWWAAAKARTMRVVKDRGNGPDRVAETPIYPPCSFCDHRAVCHGADAMAVSCRTCVHAEVKVPGDKGFWGKRSTWMCNKHGHGCGDYTACEQYQPLEEVVSF